MTITLPDEEEEKEKEKVVDNKGIISKVGPWAAWILISAPEKKHFARSPVGHPYFNFFAFEFIIYFIQISNSLECTKCTKYNPNLI